MIENNVTIVTYCAGCRFIFRQFPMGYEPEAWELRVNVDFSSCPNCASWDKVVLVKPKSKEGNNATYTAG